jgi:Tfp pilus assembly protein PilV
MVTRPSEATIVYPLMSGFTMVETLVALLLLTVGGLALIGAAASIPRLVDEARDDNEISALAAAELERLRGSVCAGSPPGERVWAGRTVSWGSTALGEGVLQVSVVIRSERRHRTRSDTLTVSMACPR